ncbi:MAG: trigger factor [Butyricicoccaceae bacterium]
MELKNTEKLEKSQVKLTVAVSAAELDAAKETAYKKNKNKITVPGFHKGKAPRKMIEKLYGEGVFLEDAINECFPAAFDFAMEQSGTKPIAQGSVDLGEMSDEGFEFLITVPVEPEVTVSEYKGLAAEKEIPVVSEEDIQQQLNVFIQRATTTETVDRAAENGDTVIIDFEGFVDGVAFEGGKGEKHSLKLGSGQFIPGFEDQLVGKKAGENVEVNVTFPEEYHAEDLKGKAAIFKCFVHEVQAEVVPELDDEFAKDVSEFETLAELKADIEKNIMENKKNAAEHDFEQKLIDKLIENMTADIPEVMFEQALDNIVNDFGMRIQQQSQGQMTLDQYMKMMGMDEAGFRGMFRPQAEQQVKTRLALTKVAEMEGIEISDETLDEEYGKLAEQYGLELAQVKMYIPAEVIKGDLLTEKALEVVKAAAVVTEKAAETEQAAD